MGTTVPKGATIRRNPWDTEVCKIATALKQTSSTISGTSQDAEGLYALQAFLEDTLNTVDHLIEKYVNETNGE